MIVTNRANALAALGEQTGDPAALEAAAAAYRQALDVLGAEHSYGDGCMRRAIAELNLGTVLVRLGDHHAPHRHWVEAMAVMLSALETFRGRQADAFVRIAEVNLRNLHKAAQGATQGAIYEAAPSAVPTHTSTKPVG